MKIAPRFLAVVPLIVGPWISSATAQNAENCESRIPISQLPYSINQPGSYFLTQNLVSSEVGIILDGGSSNSSIDLNGFTISGTGLGSTAIRTLFSPTQNVRIYNGKITNVHSGIMIDGSEIVIEDVQLDGIGNGGYGIQIEKNLNRIEGCTVSGFGRGIDGGGSSRIVGNSVRGNSHWGIRGTKGCQILNNICSNNGLGIIALDGCLIQGNISNWNLETGISILRSSSFRSLGCTVTGNQLSGNVESGIEATSENNLFLQNTVTQSPTGIHLSSEVKNSVLDGNRVMNCEIGYRVDGPGNRIIRNESLGNQSSFKVAKGNDLGPLGNAATAKSPWANLEF